MLLQFDGNLDQRFSSTHFKHIVRKFTNYRCSGIKTLVDTMAESHQLRLLILDFDDEPRDLGHTSYILQHSQNSFVCSAMQGPI